MQNRFHHEFVQSEDVVLLLKVVAQRFYQVVLQQCALSDQRVDLFLLNFPADSVDQQRNLDRVELVDDWIHLDFFAVQNLLVNVDQIVHLLDRQRVEVLVQEEQLCLMILHRVLDRSHDDIQHANVNIDLRVQVQRVDQESDLEAVVLDARNEQVDELLVRDLVLLRLHELLIVVFLAVHVEHDVDVFCCHQETLSVVLGHTRLHVVRDDNLLVVCLVVLSVR